jgi:hypothetical protein
MPAQSGDASADAVELGALLALVELERDGTFVHLMTDNLTRDQVLTIVAALRPAPSTSSI